MGTFIKQQSLAILALAAALAAIFLWRRDVHDLRLRVDALANRPAPERPAEKPANEWTCAGKIAPEHLREVIGAHGQAVHACYTEALARDPKLVGSITLHLRVGSKGEVSHTKFTGAIADPKVVECISALAVKWSFPPPSEGDCAVVNAPFAFEPPAP